MSRAGWPGRCGDHLLVGRGRRAASARCRCVSSCAEGTRGRVVELLPVDQGALPCLFTRVAGRGGRGNPLGRRRAPLRFAGAGDCRSDVALIREAVTRGAPVGCTLPARWCRSLSDVDQAVALGVRVRVVKGQWPDPAGSDPDVQRNFLAIVESLAGRASRVGVATHDPQLARAALAHLCATGTACELELLYGLPARTPLEIARAAGVPVRFYVPYGHAWLPYGLSQARQHPRVLWWAMRDLLAGSRGTGQP